MSNKYQYYTVVHIDKYESARVSADELRDSIFKELLEKFNGIISYDFICTCCEVSMGSSFSNLCTLCEDYKISEDGLFGEVHLVLITDTEITKGRKVCISSDPLIPKIVISKFDSTQYDDSYQVLLTT